MFSKGTSGNPNGRQIGSLNKASGEWRELMRRLVFDPEYQLALRKRMLDGTLPPLVETRIWAYAFGEAPKAPDEAQTGMTVNIGFLGCLSPDTPLQLASVTLQPAQVTLKAQGSQVSTDIAAKVSTPRVDLIAQTHTCELTPPEDLSSEQNGALQPTEPTVP